MLIEEDTNQAISNALLSCGFQSKKDDIFNLISWAINHMVDSPKEIIYLTQDDWITTIGIMSPDTILPAKAYYLKGLENDVVDKICNILKRKRLNATKREIHELAYEADQLNENYDKIADMKHAINYVIKIFQCGGWIVPVGFEDEFISYKRKVIPMSQIKNITQSLH